METVLMILAAKYWAFRRQNSSTTESIWWLKLAFTFPLLLNLGTLLWLLLRLNGFKPGSQVNTAVLLWGYSGVLGGIFLVVHPFIKQHAATITAPILPEDYERGNNLSWIYFILTFALLLAVTQLL